MGVSEATCGVCRVKAVDLQLERLLAANGRRGAHGSLTGRNNWNVAVVGESHLLNIQFGILAGQKSIHLC